MAVSKANPVAKKAVAPKTSVEKKPAVKKSVAAKPATKAAAKTSPSPKTTPAKTSPAKPKSIRSSAVKAARGNGEVPISPEQRYRMICDAAYYRAERRGFVGGSPSDDWIAAEVEVDELLRSMRH